MPVEQSVVEIQVAPVSVAVEATQNAFHSLMLLVKPLSGMSDWVQQTIDAMTPEERDDNELVLIGLHYAAAPQQSWPSFPAYVDHLESLDPLELRDKLLESYARITPLDEREDECADVSRDPIQHLDLDEIIEDADSYLEFLYTRFDKKHIDIALETRAYSYVIDPPAFKTLVVSHLRKMWDKYLAPEWERVEPMLQSAVSAFQQVEVHNLSLIEAAELITGQNLPEEKWKSLELVERVIFVPSAHVGPYLGRVWTEDTMWVIFGARIPKGVQFDAPDLSRAEIVVRLNALADDIRLQILKLISENGELSSKDIIETLALSQSTASRHLTQLSATGYLSERRCNGAKCYQLEAERLEDTLQAVSVFLLGS